MSGMKFWNDEYDSEEDDFVDQSFWKDDEFNDDREDLSSVAESDDNDDNDESDSDDETEGAQ